MANPEERAEQAVELFRARAEEGEEWVPFNELALAAMIEEQARRRNQRSRAMNSIRDMLALDRTPTKASFLGRHRTLTTLENMEENGQVERRFKTRYPLYGSNPQYRLVQVEEQTTQGEKAPQPATLPAPTESEVQAVVPLDGYGPTVM